MAPTIQRRLIRCEKNAQSMQSVNANDRCHRGMRPAGDHDQTEAIRTRGRRDGSPTAANRSEPCR